MGGLSIRAIGATHCLREKEFSFLLDSTTRPSDLPLNVIVESANSHSGNSQANVVLQMTPPLFGQTGNRPRALSLTLMLNPFLTFSVQQLDSLFESRRTNEDTLTTKHLGLPRPDVSIQQVSTRGGDPTSKNLNERKSWLAGCEVANAVCIFIYHCHFS